jgi:micrococcal nuclease
MYTYQAELVRVIDGDTVVLDIDLGFSLWRRDDSYRLARINAPEMKTAEGPPARTHLVSLLAQSAGPLLVTTTKADKYGRWLAEIYVNGKNMNDQMVADGFAVPYMQLGGAS